MLKQPLPDGSEIVQANLLTEIKLNEDRTAADFKFTPPAGVKEFVQPDIRANLVQVGKKAPDFNLPTPTGGMLSPDGVEKLVIPRGLG